MRKKPYFSIVIPTYNRCSYLKATISVLLRQTYKDFEIVICDNASTDGTYEMIKSLKNKRIRYIGSDKSCSFPNNAKKAILAARGEYIFTLGDDDFILFDETLARIKRIVDEKKYGFIRLNILEHSILDYGLKKKFMFLNKDKSIRKYSSSQEIIDFFKPLVLGLISGLVFRNTNIDDSKFINCEICPWFDVAFENTKKYGAMFLSHHYIVATLVSPKVDIDYSYPLYKVHDNKLELQIYIDHICKFITQEQTRRYKLNFYKSFIRLLPCVKLYSSNANLVTFLKLVIKIEPSLIYSFNTWIMFTISLLIPKQVWLIVRKIQHKYANRIYTVSNLPKINSRFQYLFNRYYFFEKNNSGK